MICLAVKMTQNAWSYLCYVNSFLFVPAKYLFNLSRDKVLFDKQLLDAKNSQHCVGPYDTIFNDQFALKRLGSIFLRHKWIYLFSVPV